MHDRLTKGDIEKMQAEIDERRLKLQPQLIAEVQEARAQGDLSENFEYHAAADEVSMDKSVEVYFPEDDETETFRIVTTIRGNSLKNLISIDSPLGRALLHHKAGDTVHVKVNENAGYDVVVKRIGADEGEAGDTIRAF